MPSFCQTLKKAGYYSVLGLMIGGCLGISTFDARLTELGYVMRYFIYGIGLGLFQSPNNSNVMGAVSRDRLGMNFTV